MRKEKKGEVEERRGNRERGGGEKGEVRRRRRWREGGGEEKGRGREGGGGE